MVRYRTDLGVVVDVPADKGDRRDGLTRVEDVAPAAAPVVEAEPAPKRRGPRKHIGVIG